MSQTVSIIFKSPDGKQHSIEAPVGISLMQAAVMNNVPGIDAECGGACACATCHVYGDDQCLKAAGNATEQESDMLDFAVSERRPASRLACQLEVTPALNGAVFEIPETQY